MANVVDQLSRQLFQPQLDAGLQEAGRLIGALIEEEVEFFQPLKNDDDGLRGFEVKDADGYVLFFGRPC